MRREEEMARQELDSTKYTLKDMTKKLGIPHMYKRDCAHQQVQKKFETTVADHVHFEEELLTKN